MTRKERYEEYLLSDHWKDLRLRKLQSVGRACFNCNRHGRLHVHHVNYKDLTDCGMEDLTVLCEECHKVLHQYLQSKGMDPSELQEGRIREAIAVFVAAPDYKPAHWGREKKRKKPLTTDTMPERGDRRKAIRAAVTRCKRWGCSDCAVNELIRTLQCMIISIPDAMSKVEQAPPVERCVFPGLEDDKTAVRNNGSFVVLTKKLIHQCSTQRHGFSGATLKALGVDTQNMKKGWLKRLVGAMIPKEKYEEAVEGRNAVR